MLSVGDRLTYEVRLLDERRRAVRILDERAREQVSDETGGDDSDRAAVETDHHRCQLVSVSESDTVAAIDEALRLFATAPERYGFCRECGRPIARGRLDVLPWALECERHASSRLGAA